MLGLYSAEWNPFTQGVRADSFFLSNLTNTNTNSTNNSNLLVITMSSMSLATISTFNDLSLVKTDDCLFYLQAPHTLLPFIKEETYLLNQLNWSRRREMKLTYPVKLEQQKGDWVNIVTFPTKPMKTVASDRPIPCIIIIMNVKIFESKTEPAEQTIKKYI